MMIKLTIKTQNKKEIVDITDRINEELKKQDVRNGVVNLFVTHTTAALTIADLDPRTDQDYLDAFEKLVPKLNFRHPHNPMHTPDHILSSLIGASFTLLMENGKLVLGIWQRVVLVEFNGPKERQIIINLLQSN